MYKIYIIIGIVFWVTTGVVQAQEEDWETGTGEIQEAEVVIEKDRIIRLPQAGRSFEKIPETDRTSQAPDLDFRYQPIDFTIPELSLRLRPLTVKPEPLPKVYRGNIKAGYGNFGTPFGELSFGSGRSDEYYFNALVRHISSAKGPVDDNNSGNSQNLVSLDGNIFLNNVTAGGTFNYQRDGFYFYGYDQGVEVDREDIKQVLNDISIEGFIENKGLPDQGYYNFNVVFDYIGDDYDANEADIGFNFDGKFSIKDQYRAGIKANLNLINRSDLLLPSFNRFFLNARPYLEYHTDNLITQVGLTVVNQDDTIQNAKSLHVFPYLDVSYQLSDKVQFYAGFRGDVEKQTLKTYLRRNRWLNSNVNVFNTINTINFYGGLSGKAGKLGYDVNFALQYYKNMFFFTNAATDTTKFDIIYDTGTTNVNNLGVRLSYDVSNKLILGMEGNYYLYQTDVVENPWHKPSYDVLFLSKYTFNNKFSIAFDSYLMGGISAPGPNSGQEIELEPVIDLIVKLDYHLSDRASIFVHGYNLLNREYQRYLNYPHRGLQVLGGLSYSF